MLPQLALPLLEIGRPVNAESRLDPTAKMESDTANTPDMKADLHAISEDDSNNECLLRPDRRYPPSFSVICGREDYAVTRWRF